MVDVCLKNKFAKVVGYIGEMMSFSYDLFGIRNDEIRFKVGGDIVSKEDVFDVLAGLSLTKSVVDLDVFSYELGFTVDISVKDTEDHSTNIDIDFLEQIKNIIDSIEGCDNGKEQ